MFRTMSVNSSSSNVLHRDLLNATNSSLPSQEALCFRSSISIALFSAFSVTNVLLLPLLFLIFYLGYQQWREHRSVPTTASFNPNVFTYHSVLMQLIEFLGLVLHFCSGYSSNTKMKEAGIFLWLFTTVGQALFHLLSCLELYMAVVHPITFMGLRKPLGVRIRNVIIGSVWFLSFGWMILIHITSPDVFFYMHISILVVFMIIVSFCSFFILCALKRPGPGDGSNKQQGDMSKQKAFHTIIAVFGALLLRFFSNLTSNAIHRSGVINPRYVCVVILSSFWLDFPSNLVLPLLFLRRAGKLP